MCVLSILLTALVAAQATNSTERKYPKEVNSIPVFFVPSSYDYRRGGGETDRGVLVDRWLLCALYCIESKERKAFPSMTTGEKIADNRGRLGPALLEYIPAINQVPVYLFCAHLTPLAVQSFGFCEGWEKWDRRV